MLTRFLSGTVIGIHGVLVEVEAEQRDALTTTTPDSLRESRIRAETALRATRPEFTLRRVSYVNVAPSDLRVHGAHLDLPLALAMLEASGPDLSDGKRHLVVGELSLEGAVRPVRGVLSLAIAARENGLTGIVVPHTQVREASVVAGIEVVGVRTLTEAIAWAKGLHTPERTELDLAGIFNAALTDEGPDFSEIRGLTAPKRALEIAAAGGHNALLVGVPGSGKTMLARRLPTILPPMSFAEALETTKVYSVAGLLPEGEALVVRRPFRAPHHTISDAGLIGGGTSAAVRPGEVSLAHNGVLFLDELTEFKKHVLEVLRQPLEDHRATIHRALSTITYPAATMLVGAMNPCPCGYAGSARCACTPAMVRSYSARAATLLPRFDVHVEVPQAPRALPGTATPESSATIRERVMRAHEVQAIRFARTPRVYRNAQMGPRLIRAHCALDTDGAQLLASAVNTLALSAHQHDQVFRVARTIADLDASERIQTQHLAEAIRFRTTTEVK